MWSFLSYPWFQTMRNFKWKVFIFLLTCGYSLKTPHQGAFNEYAQHMISWRNKKKNLWIPLLFGASVKCRYLLLVFQDFEMTLKIIKKKYKWAASSKKGPSSMLRMRGFTSSCTCAKSHPGICSPLKRIIANDFVCEQQRPWLDCADAQADLGLRCSYVPEDTFWHGEAHVF